MLGAVLCKESDIKTVLGVKQNDIGCKHRSTLGRDYIGRANTTKTGIPCQKWSDTEPHEHQFTDVGDHNHCRNPEGTYSNVWCFTTDPDTESQYCSVPDCPALKVLDFSLDNDWKRDANGSYTHASLRKENFPSSFTICIAFMVEGWGAYRNSPLFLILDNIDNTWLYVELYATPIHTEFRTRFSGERFTVTDSSIFFPLQWTRVCFSFNSNTSMATIVVDGKQLGEKIIAVDYKPVNLSMIVGWSGIGAETPGKITDVNIFSKPLTNTKELTKAGTDNCGAPGDFLNWEEADWTLHSKARIIEVDSAKGPCRIESKMHVYRMIEEHDHSFCIRGRCQHARKHFFLQILSRHMFFFVFLNFKRGFFS